MSGVRIVVDLLRSLALAGAVWFVAATIPSGPQFPRFLLAYILGAPAVAALLVIAASPSAWARGSMPAIRIAGLLVLPVLLVVDLMILSTFFRGVPDVLTAFLGATLVSPFILLLAPRSEESASVVVRAVRALVPAGLAIFVLGAIAFSMSAQSSATTVADGRPFRILTGSPTGEGQAVSPPMGPGAALLLRQIISARYWAEPGRVSPHLELIVGDRASSIETYHWSFARWAFVRKSD